MDVILQGSFRADMVCRPFLIHEGLSKKYGTLQSISIHWLPFMGMPDFRSQARCLKAAQGRLSSSLVHMSLPRLHYQDLREAIDEQKRLRAQSVQSEESTPSPVRVAWPSIKGNTNLFGWPHKVGTYHTHLFIELFIYFFLQI